MFTNQTDPYITGFSLSPRVYLGDAPLETATSRAWFHQCVGLDLALSSKSIDILPMPSAAGVPKVSPNHVLSLTNVRGAQ